MEKQLFRKIALERLSSPEQLDQLMRVTTPRGWLALIALGSVLFVVIVWSMIGSIPTKITGRGILIKSGGILDIVSLGDGQVIELKVKNGEYVRQNQVVAKVAQTELIGQIKKDKATLEEMRRQHEDITKFSNQNIRMQSDLIAKKRESLKYSTQVAEERLKWLEEKISIHDELLKEGLITRQTLLSTKQSYFATKEEIDRLKNEFQRLSVEKLSLSNEKQRAIFESQLKINEMERKILQLETELEIKSEVISHRTGRILEVLVGEGDFVNKGSPLFKLETEGNESTELEAVFYVSPADGKKVRPGMMAQISPSVVSREEYGFMKAEVKSVAEFPSTFQGMVRVLKNEQLASTLSGGGAPFEIYAKLETDPGTTSGYKWSSPEGPPVKIYSGTLSDVMVTIRRQSPISLVLPILKQRAGI